MLKTYNAKQVVVIFGGQTLTGYADGEFARVEMAEDSWNHTVGADGEEARSATNNNSATLTLKFLQTSDANRILSEAWRADKASPGAGVKPCMVADKSGTSLHASKQAYIVKPADAPYGKTVSEREWVIRLTDAEHFNGGNNA